MCWDCASVAKRGSRLAGLDSMRKTSEEESGWTRREQPAKENAAPMNSKEKDLTQRAQSRHRERGEDEALFSRGIEDLTENGRAPRPPTRSRLPRPTIKPFIA